MAAPLQGDEEDWWREVRTNRGEEATAEPVRSQGPSGIADKGSAAVPTLTRGGVFLPVTYQGHGSPGMAPEAEVARQLTYPAGIRLSPEAPRYEGGAPYH